MEIFVSDCFPPIFSFLSLSDLLNLRAVSRRLKQEVEDYLPNVRSLPLYLTTPRTSKEIVTYDNMFVLERKLLKSSTRFEKALAVSFITNDERDHYVNMIINSYEDRLEYVSELSFGTSGRLTFEDRTILRNQTHFRCDDFLILNHSSALLKFLPFIKKHCPKIDKLAIVIDNCDHYLPEVSRILEAFPGIKVLLIESTLQDACRHDAFRKLDTYEELDKYLCRLLNREYIKNCLELPAEVSNSILKLKNLEELYLFSKHASLLRLFKGYKDLEENFIRLLAGRLRILHFNTLPDYIYDLRSSYQPLNEEDYNEPRLQELACGKDPWPRENHFLVFPSLKKLTMFTKAHPWVEEFVSSQN